MAIIMLTVLIPSGGLHYILSVVKAGYSCSCAGDLVHPYKLCTSTMNNLNMYICMGLHELQVEVWGSRT